MGTAPERFLDREAAADGDVGPDSVTATAQFEQSPGRNLDRPPTLERPSRDGGVRLGARQGNESRRSEAQRRPDECRLECGCARVVPDEAAPELQ